MRRSLPHSGHSVRCSSRWSQNRPSSRVNHRPPAGFSLTIPRNSWLRLAVCFSVFRSTAWSDFFHPQTQLPKPQAGPKRLNQSPHRFVVGPAVRGTRLVSNPEPATRAADPGQFFRGKTATHIPSGPVAAPRLWLPRSPLPPGGRSSSTYPRLTPIPPPSVFPEAAQLPLCVPALEYLAARQDRPRGLSPSLVAPAEFLASFYITPSLVTALKRAAIDEHGGPLSLVPYPS